MGNPEAQSAARLAAQQAAAAERFRKTITQGTTESKGDPRVYELWAGYPTTVRVSAAEGMGIGFGPTNRAELAASMTGFIKAMRAKVGEGEVDYAEAAETLSARPYRYKSASENPIRRDREVNGARYLIENLEVMREEVLTPDGPDTGQTDFTTLQTEVAILAAKTHHLAHGLKNTSEYNHAARLDFLNTLMRETLQPTVLDDDAEFAASLVFTPPPKEPYRPPADIPRRETKPEPTPDQVARNRLRTRVAEIFGEPVEDQSA